MNLQEKVIKGFAWTFLQGAGSQVISFLVFLVLARLLDPEKFGLVAMATVVIAFLKLFSYFGFGTAIIQRKELDKAHLDTAFWVDTGASVIMMAVAVITAGWVAMLYSEPQLGSIIQTLSLVFILTALSQVQTSILRRKMAFKLLAIRTMAAQIIGGIVGVTLAVKGFGVWSLVARQLTTSISDVLILWILSDWRPGLDVSYKHFKDLFGFSVKMMGANIVEFFSSKSDSALIGYFLGPVILGYYTIAYRLVLVLTEFLGGTVNRVAWPAFARLQDEPDRLRKGFYSASQMLGLVVFPVFLGVFAVASDIVPFMFGEQWGQSIKILQVLVFIGIIHSVSKLYDTIIVSMGRPGLWLGMRTAIGISNVIAFLIAMQWGVMGVAIAYVSVGYLYYPVYLLILNRLIKIDTKRYLGLLAAPISSALIMAITVFAIKIPLADIELTSVRLFIFITFGMLTYLGVLRLISPATVQHAISVFRSIMPGKRVER